MSKAKALLFDLGSSVSYGRLTILGKILFPMLVIKADDQGRGLAEADAVKWRVCPNVTELTPEAIEQVLLEMSSPEVDLLRLYDDHRGRRLFQFIRWWVPEVGSGSCLQWAKASEYDPPEGWTDRIRQQRGPGKKPLLIHWRHPGGYTLADATDEATPSGTDIPNQLPNDLASGQYNLTKPNIIEPKQKQRVPSDQTQPEAESKQDGADAPPPTPAPKKRKAAKRTEGQRGVLKLWGAKRYRTIAAADHVLELEQKYGTAVLLKAAKWAATKQMSLGDGILAIGTALENNPTWDKAQERKGEADDSSPAQDVDKVRAQLKRGAGVEGPRQAAS